MNITESNQFLYVTAQLQLHSLSEIKQFLPPFFNDVEEKWMIHYGVKVNKLDESGKFLELAWPQKNHTLTIECDIRDKVEGEEEREDDEDWEGDDEDETSGTQSVRIIQSSSSMGPPSSDS